MKAGPVLRFLGNGAGLKEVGKVGSVSRVREIRTDVEDILPSAQIGQRGPIFVISPLKLTRGISG
jgi:hypothetical protein